MFGKPQIAAALLFLIETDGVKIYTIEDRYPIPLG